MKTKTCPGEVYSEGEKSPPLGGKRGYKCRKKMLSKGPILPSKTLVKREVEKRKAEQERSHPMECGDWGKSAKGNSPEEKRRGVVSDNCGGLTVDEMSGSMFCVQRNPTTTPSHSPPVPKNKDKASAE